MDEAVTPRPSPRPTEAQCQDTIVEAALLGGWMVHATRAARTATGWRTPVQGHPGFPDLVLVHPSLRLLFFVELKRKPNKIEPEQQRWLDALEAAGAKATVWWVPEQLDQIVAMLTNGTEPE